MTPDAASKKSLVVRIVVALLLALAILFVVVLPAEYSLDPLGSGDALGVLGLAEGGDAALIAESDAHRVDTRDFILAPFESVEYSYNMPLGASMVFSWQASDELVFNLHSSPAVPPQGAAADYAESFSNGRANAAQGTYTATFNGRHGWFWENRTNAEVTLRVAVAGFVGAAQTSSLAGQEIVETRSSLKP